MDRPLLLPRRDYGGAYLISVLFYGHDQALIRRSALWAFGGVVVGSFLLIIDLGQPLRFLNLLLGGFYPASAMWLGTWFLLISGAGLLWVYLRTPRGGSSRWWPCWWPWWWAILRCS